VGHASVGECYGRVDGDGLEPAVFGQSSPDGADGARIYPDRDDVADAQVRPFRAF